MERAGLGKIFISDFYTATNPEFLQKRGVDIVVKMIGQMDDEGQDFWSPLWHWKADKENYKTWWDIEMQENQMQMVEEISSVNGQ